MLDLSNFLVTQLYEYVESLDAENGEDSSDDEYTPQRRMAEQQAPTLTRHVSFAEYTSLPSRDDRYYSDYELRDSHSDVLVYYEKQQKENEFIEKRYNELRDEFRQLSYRNKIVEQERKKLTDRLQELHEQMEKSTAENKNTIKTLQQKLKIANTTIQHLRKANKRDSNGQSVTAKRPKSSQEVVELVTSQIIRTLRSCGYEDCSTPSLIQQAAELSSKLIQRQCTVSSTKLMDAKYFVDASGVVIDDQLVVFGGRDQNELCNDEITKINLEGGSIESTTIAGDVRVSRYSHCCAIGTQKQLLVFGGLGSFNDTNIPCFDFNSATWTFIPSRNEFDALKPFESQRLCVNNQSSEIIISDSNNEHLTLWSMNLVSYNWQRLEAIASSGPISRNRHSMNLYDNQFIVLFGGLSTNGEILSDLWIFDFSKMKWVEMHYLKQNSPAARHSHSAIINSDSLFVFGGKDCNGVKLLDLWEFNLHTKRWIQYDLDRSLVPHFADHLAVLHSDQMIVCGPVSESTGSCAYLLRIQIPISIPAPHHSFGGQIHRALASNASDDFSDIDIVLGQESNIEQVGLFI